MSKRKKHWYLVTYDVRDMRRLRKIHKHLLKDGIPVQQSVFIIRTHTKGIDATLQGCRNILDLDEDDFAILKTSSPDDMWRYGCGADQALWKNSALKTSGTKGNHANETSMLQKIKRTLLWKH